MLTTVWKEYEVEKRKEKEKREEASNPRGEKDGKIGSRQ